VVLRIRHLLRSLVMRWSRGIRVGDPLVLYIHRLLLLLQLLVLGNMVARHMHALLFNGVTRLLVRRLLPYLMEYAFVV